MNKMIFALAALSTLAGCTTQEHYYTTEERRVYVRPRPVVVVRKTPPAVSDSAEDFHAVEKPGSYSQ